MEQYIGMISPPVCSAPQKSTSRNLFTESRMRTAKFAAFAFAVLSLNRYAVAAPPITGGGAIQQIPQAPTLQKQEIVLPSPAGQGANRQKDTGPKFAVKTLHITGATRFSEAQLIAVSGFKPSTVMGLAGLRSLAAKITQYYNRTGSVIAQAYLPPQEIANGAVTIAVIEGRYGKIGINNTTNISDVRLVSMLSGLNSGDPITVAPLQRRLLIISDLPGINASSTLAPGTEVGTADMLVSVRPGARVDGSVEADNAGNPYTGRYRVGATVNFNEPLGIGDLLSARFLGSATGGMQYGRAFYQAPIGEATVGIAYTYFDYHLGKQFRPLDATGSEQIVSLFGSYPLIRSYNNNLNLFGDFDYRKLHDRLGAFDTSTDKQAFVGSFGLDGSYRDELLTGGVTSYTLTGTFGDLDIQTANARELDAATARTNGAYAKFTYDLSRLQHVVGPLSLFGEVRGQFASKNLDESEKMELGGAGEVRAYPEGEAYGDQGYVATVEARLLLPRWPARLPGNIELVGFADTGSVVFNENRYFNGPNRATRSGAGVGLVWAEANNFSASIFYAHELGGQRATSYTDYGDEIWLRAVKYY
jgi:hemolysin activation/secretion protein